jgi:hypothetical protein
LQSVALPAWRRHHDLKRRYLAFPAGFRQANRQRIISNRACTPSATTSTCTRLRSPIRSRCRTGPAETARSSRRCRLAAAATGIPSASVDSRPTSSRAPRRHTPSCRSCRSDSRSCMRPSGPSSGTSDRRRNSASRGLVWRDRDRRRSRTDPRPRLSTATSSYHNPRSITRTRRSVSRQRQTRT